MFRPSVKCVQNHSFDVAGVGHVFKNYFGLLAGRLHADIAVVKNVAKDAFEFCGNVLDAVYMRFYRAMPRKIKLVNINHAFIADNVHVEVVKQEDNKKTEGGKQKI